MSITNSIYYPDGHAEFNSKLLKKNNELEIKLTNRLKYWDDIYSDISSKIININGDNLMEISNLHLLETSILNLHEAVRRESYKLFKQLSKANDKKDEYEAEIVLFYMTRKDILNIPNSKGTLDILVSGLSRQRDRTCKLYESIIDYLNDLKDLLYEMKFKIARTRNVFSGNA